MLSPVLLICAVSNNRRIEALTVNLPTLEKFGQFEARQLNYVVAEAVADFKWRPTD